MIFFLKFNNLYDVFREKPDAIRFSMTWSFIYLFIYLTETETTVYGGNYSTVREYC